MEDRASGCVGRRNQKRWIPFVPIWVHPTCMSSAGQLFASQYKGLVGM